MVQNKISMKLNKKKLKNGYKTYYVLWFNDSEYWTTKKHVKKTSVAKMRILKWMSGYTVRETKK